MPYQIIDLVRFNYCSCLVTYNIIYINGVYYS